mmetsp:Transcript_22407/g.39931  ORF Transcript_22407/g.39931 Transcript_22407/m.39931 type:complete len:829 (-) Transcript_22407:225-2711(-)
MSCCPCFVFAGRTQVKHGRKNTAEKKEQARRKTADKEENRKYEDLVQFFEKIPLFKGLPRNQIPIVAANCEFRAYRAGENIFEQGEMGSKFFMIQAGSASAFRTEADGEVAKVNELKAGDSFGKSSLFAEEPRRATITANSDIVCLTLTKDKFQELGLHETVSYPKRQKVGSAVKPNKIVKKPPALKFADDRKLIAEALRNNADLQVTVGLDDDRIRRMIDVAWKEEFAEGETIIRENDVDADYFYIIHKGSAFVGAAADQELSPQTSRRRSANKRIMQRGDSFGELALLYSMPRSATIRALEKCTLWVFDRDSFKNILMHASNEQIKKNMGLLDRVEILEILSEFEKRQIAEALVEMRFSKGEIVMQQGATDTGFYIMREGSVSVSVNGREVRRDLVRPDGEELQSYGEKALLKHEVRTATVQVISETATMLVLDRDTFELVLRPLEDIITSSAVGRAHDGKILTPGANTSANEIELMQKSMLARVSSEASAKKRQKKIDLKELETIGLLGCGGFGKVELVENQQTGEIYALKEMSKGFIVKQHMQACIVNEKRILAMMDSPFIIKLHSVYNLPQEVYFLMEPALGGELYVTYRVKNLYGLSGHARYYSAGVVCALEYLHERRVAFRDLKPENLLLNELGHLKLTDMGLAKFIIGKTYTICGTPDYFAPEVITSVGHNRAVDWWCLGILLFEMHTKKPPFEAHKVMAIYAKIRAGIGKVAFPPPCQGDVKNLITGLCTSDPSDRLPMRKGGVTNVKKHPWYVKSSFNWQQHFSGKMTPPYKPNVKSKNDLSNFRPHGETPTALFEDDGSGWDKEFGPIVHPEVNSAT